MKEKGVLQTARRSAKAMAHSAGDEDRKVLVLTNNPPTRIDSGEDFVGRMPYGDYAGGSGKRMIRVAARPEDDEHYDIAFVHVPFDGFDEACSDIDRLAARGVPVIAFTCSCNQHARERELGALRARSIVGIVDCGATWTAGFLVNALAETAQ